MKQGMLVIITGCSGAGKKTVRRRLREDNPDLTYYPLYTTRLPKKKEQPGKDFCFISEAEFLDKEKEGDFLFSYKEGKLCYGIDKKATEKALSEGKVLLVDLSHPAAKELRKLYKGRYTLTIDIVIPAEDVLESRVRRGLHGLSPYQIHKAVREASADNKDTADYDVVLNNYELKRTVKRCNQAIQGRLNYINTVEEGKEPPATYIIKRP